MGASSLNCRECGAQYELDASYVCERCFGPLEVAYDHTRPDDGRRRDPPPDPGRAAEHLALRRLPAAHGRAARPVRARVLARRAARGLHAADPRRPARRAPRPRRGVGQERRRQPDALVQGPRRQRRRGARARARLRRARLRLDRQPRELRRRPRRRARPRELRLHPRRPRGAEDPRDRRLRHEPRRSPRQLRRRQPPLHRALGRARLGVRQRQPAPLLRRGLEDDRLGGRRAAGLAHAGPHRRAGRLGLALHEDRQGLRASGSSSGSSAASCRS